MLYVFCSAIGFAPLAGWIDKEHYGDANSWMLLDVGISHTDPRAAAVMIGEHVMLNQADL